MIEKKVYPKPLDKTTTERIAILIVVITFASVNFAVPLAIVLGKNDFPGVTAGISTIISAVLVILILPYLNRKWTKLNA